MSKTRKISGKPPATNMLFPIFSPYLSIHFPHVSHHMFPMFVHMFPICSPYLFICFPYLSPCVSHIFLIFPHVCSYFSPYLSPYRCFFSPRAERRSASLERPRSDFWVAQGRPLAPPRHPLDQRSSGRNRQGRKKDEGFLLRFLKTA